MAFKFDCDNSILVSRDCGLGLGCGRWRGVWRRSFSLGRHMRPGRGCRSVSVEVGSVWRCSAQSDGVLDDGYVCLHVLCAFRCCLDVLEDLAHRRLSQDLADERDGRFQVWLHYIPWHLVLPPSVYRLQLIACLSEVCGLLVDVFWAVGYPRPPGCHYREFTRFRRIFRGNCLARYREPRNWTKFSAFSKMCSELCVVFFCSIGFPFVTLFARVFRAHRPSADSADSSLPGTFKELGGQPNPKAGFSNSVRDGEER